MQFGNIIYFLVWAAAIFFMMRYGCGAHIMGRGQRRGADSPPNGRPSGGVHERATDPVCGKIVPTATAKSSIYRGHAYYFCSLDCREKFEANPDAYASMATGVPLTQHEGHHHGC